MTATTSALPTSDLALSLHHTAQRDVEYRLNVTHDIFNPDNLWLAGDHRAHCAGEARAVVLDEALALPLAGRIQAYFQTHDIDAHILLLPSGEARKEFESTLKVVAHLEKVGIKRTGNDVIAVGGNVLLDIAGFAASIYRRGVPWTRIPTTLLGIVDGSVSAKTGVNHNGSRNRLGSFHPASQTFIDASLLASLPSRQLSNACGEILKMALIKDRRLFELLELHGAQLIESAFQHPAAAEVIERSIVGMHEELRDNLWERDLKRIVDYGHIFSPPIEMAVVPELFHGEAVAIDCLFSAAIAENRGNLSAVDVERIRAVMAQVGLPTFHRGFASSQTHEHALAESRLHRGGNLNLPLLNAIGSCGFTQTVTSAELQSAVDRLVELDGAR